MLRLVQLQRGPARRVAVVEEPNLRALDSFDSMYALVRTGLSSGTPIADLVEQNAGGERLSYDDVYEGRSPWRLLVPIDHPVDSAQCLVSGTGLTHLGSAESRSAMHGKHNAELTDSMKMFRSGLEKGRPAPGGVGTPPEWFYKGTGRVLRAHGEPLDVPEFSDDGGEEAEIAGVYVVDDDGRPRRIGMAAGNEFSDHVFERANYLNLAASKLRTCAIGPELAVDANFSLVPGRVAIERGGRAIWQREIATGQLEMCHSLENIEHHHFKFASHRRPGDLHVHFLGAHSLSYGDAVRLVDGDVMVIQFDGFGRPLRNPVRWLARPDRAVPWTASAL